MPNAIDLLKKDHDKVRKLLKQLTDSSNRAEVKRSQLLSEIQNELEIHTLLEEEIFYPEFRKADPKAHAELYYESLEEHRIVEEMVLPDVEGSDTGSEEFAGRAKVLREPIEHHAEDEEEEMFPKAREVFSDEQLEELGERMAARKKELMQEA